MPVPQPKPSVTDPVDKTIVGRFLEILIPLGGVLLLLGAVFFFFFIAHRSTNVELERYLTYAIIFAGAALGWALGTFISPDDTAQAARFGAIAKAVATFFSGYLISKLDKDVNALFETDLILQPLPGIRLLLFVSSFVVMLMTTFLARTYLWEPDPEKPGDPETLDDAKKTTTDNATQPIQSLKPTTAAVTVAAAQEVALAQVAAHL